MVEIPKRTVNYWLSSSLPVIFVIVDPAGRCYYTPILRDSPRLRQTPTKYRITVPRNQRLDASARGALLDLDAGAFVGTDRYFGTLLDGDRTFHHARPLVGRERELRGIITARPSGLSVIEVSGRAGIGKTRLLLEAARLAAWPARWVRDHVEVTPASARQIPPGPLLLIADDVHLRSDLAAICDLAVRRQEPTVLVLGMRPWARAMARSAVAAASIPLNQVRAIQIGELPRPALVPLLRSELGPTLAHHAEALAWQLGDSTLVALAGARFLRDEQIEPALLERSAAFRHEVLSRFEDAVLGDFADTVDSVQARKLLRLVSIAGPVTADDPDWVRKAAEFLGFPTYELIELVAVLEAGEVLVRRYARVRVTPDVLADHLVHVATVTQTGRLSGYPGAVLDALGPDVLPQLVRNLAELDWRLSVSGQAAPVLNDVWERFRDVFESADNLERLRRLYDLRLVAAIQPRRVYELCHWLTVHPLGEEPGSPLLSDGRVLEAALPVLGELLADESIFAQAATLIYRIGRDLRTHDPLYELTSRIGYHPERPTWVQEQTVDCLEAWTAEPAWADHAHSPLGVCDMLLRKEQIFALPRGRTFGLAPLPVPAEQMAVHRMRLIGLLGRLARGDSARGRIQAVDVLLTALTRPPRSLGRPVSEQEVTSWLQQDLAAAEELRAAGAAGDPLVRLRVRDGLLDLDDRNQVAVSDAVRATAEEIGDSDELAFYRAWSGAVPRTTARRKARPGGRVRTIRAAFMRGVAARLAGHQSAREVAAKLDAVERAYSAAALASRPDELLGILASSAPELADAVAREIVETGGPLAGRVGALLAGIGGKRRRMYRDLLARFLAVGGLALRSVAAALARAAFERSWTEYEAGYARSLAGSDDDVVRGSILHAAAAASVRPQLTLELLSASSVGADLWLGELFADAAEVAVERSGTIVDRSIAAALLRQLAGVPRFSESGGVTRFLSSVAARWPEELMDFVIRRVRMVEAANRIDEAESDVEARPRALYSAVPRGDWSEVWTAVRASEGYAAALARLRDESAGAEGVVTKEFQRIFNELAGLDDQTEEVLLQWLESGDRQLAEATLPLVAQLPAGFVFARPAFAGRALDAGYALGTPVGAGVALALDDSLQPRMGFRGHEYVRYLETLSQRAEACGGEADSDRGASFFRGVAESAVRAAEAQARRDAEVMDDAGD